MTLFLRIRKLMKQLKTRLSKLSNRTKVIIALVVIALAVVGAFFAPPEGDATNTTGDLATTPTLTITHLVDTLSVNRKTTFNGIELTVTKAMEATKFSDDRKRASNYTVRVLIEESNPQQAVVGVDYPSLIRLQLPDGSSIAPKYVALKPALLPKSTQSGFVDFPLNSQIPLSSLLLSLGNQTTLAFSG